MDWITTPGGVSVMLALLIALLGGLAWVIKAQIAMAREFHPNHGSSMKDQLTRIETDIRDVRTRMDDHIAYHLQENL